MQATQPFSCLFCQPEKRVFALAKICYPDIARPSTCYFSATYSAHNLQLDVNEICAYMDPIHRSLGFPSKPNPNYPTCLSKNPIRIPQNSNSQRNIHHQPHHWNIGKNMFIYVCLDISRWWFHFFYFYPYLGKIPILTNIFQMGWNHQPDMYMWLCLKIVDISSSRNVHAYELTHIFIYIYTYGMYTLMSSFDMYPFLFIFIHWLSLTIFCISMKHIYIYSYTQFMWARIWCSFWPPFGDRPRTISFGGLSI